MEGSASTLTSVFTTVAADMTSAVEGIAPIALGVGAAVLVITLGWKLFKKLTK